MNGDKRPPEVEPETTEEEEEEEEEEERTDLLRKTFRQDAQSSISSSDSDEMYSQSEDSTSQRPKFVIRDEQEQEQEQGTGFSNGSSRLETDGDHAVIYEVNPTDEIEDVTARKTGVRNGTAIMLQRDQIPLTVANPPSKGEILEQASYYTSLDNGSTASKTVELRTENGNEVADLYLERIYEKPSSHNFYCPNCQACVTKVIIRDKEWVNNTVSVAIPTQVDKVRCTSCLSFLTPIGTWLFPKLVSPEEEVSTGLGNNDENIGIRERETLQVLTEIRDNQASQVNGAAILDQSVGYAVTDKNEGDHDVTLARPTFIATSDDGRIVQEETLYNGKVVPDQSVGNAVADQTQKRDCAVPDPTSTHFSLHAIITDKAVVLDEEMNSKQGKMTESNIVGRPNSLQELAETIYDQEIQAASINKPQVPDQLVEFIVLTDDKTLETKVDSTVDLDGHDGGAKDRKKGNIIESIAVGRTDPLQKSAETMYDQEIRAASINKPQVPDQLVEFNMLKNDKAEETKVDSTFDWNVLDGAKDSKKGSAVDEDIVVGIAYPSHESNGSVLDVDNQASTVDIVQVPNQSNGFAILLESEIDTKANSTPGLTSLEAMVTDTLDGKNGIDIENVVVGIPNQSQEPKGGLLDRFSLSALINRAPVPDHLAGVAKTEIPKTPEPVVATVPESLPDSRSLRAPTAENVLDTAVDSREGPVAIPIDDSLDEQVDSEPSRFNGWEIVKSIVYGGLAESITSLGIVASAASANTATGNIVVLVLANLISGLFILGHNLAGLKSEQFRRAPNETDDQQHVDRYEEALGNRENYILHYMVAILSFVIFGMVPPLVYGFSFTKSNDKDFKLLAVAGASLLCITLLAIGKAHTQRPNRWDVYVKTVATYVIIAAGAGGFSYLAGDLIDRLIKKYGWFEESSAVNLNLPLPEMSLAKPAWGSS